ncbi:MAG: hypothetical protein WAW88_02165, partial [Nocardioides sp.]
MAQSAGPDATNLPTRPLPADADPEPSDDFGANEWLVEEMHEQFLADPLSVDPAWAHYFRTQGMSNGNATQQLPNLQVPSDEPVKPVAASPAVASPAVSKPAVANPVAASPVAASPVVASTAPVVASPPPAS